MVFCEEVSRKLLCMLCHKVFKDPVIASCGVSYLIGITPFYNVDYTMCFVVCLFFGLFVMFLGYLRDSYINY